MKKLLYVKHAFHNKTKSNDFLIEILSKNYEIHMFDFDTDRDNFDKFNTLKGQKFDCVILFQVMPSIKKLKELIEFKHIVFFPMYDAARSLNQPLWSEYRDCNIINFSKTLHEKCLEKGLSSYYLQYFPKPQEVKDFGDENSVFFWQRRNNITAYTIEKLLDTTKINKLYYHKAPDPNCSFVKPSSLWDGKIEYSEWFESKEDMISTLKKAAIYFAPRIKEGIGMSFLDAMALGRCVIAPDNPTMNEYIINGVNGYLYKPDALKKIKLGNIREIQQNALDFIKNGSRKWDMEKDSILKIIESAPQINEKLADKTLLTEIKKLYILKFIPILRIDYTNISVVYKLFHTIPIMKCNKKNWRNNAIR